MLRKFISAQSDRAKLPTCHQSDWLELVSLAMPEVLYVFGSLSASADEVYFTQDRHSLHWQFKNVKAALTVDSVLEEAKKVALLAVQDVPEKKYSLVIVSLTVDQSQIVAAVPSSQLVQDDKNVTVSVRLPASATITLPKEKWVVPDNMDIIVLTEGGVKLLLTEYNYALLKTGSQNIEDYLRGIPIPRQSLPPFLR